MTDKLQIWAAANCRSVMSLYECLAKEFGVELRIICEDDGGARMKLGWDPDEFSHLNIVRKGHSLDDCLCQLKESGRCAQWFASYQKSAFIPHIAQRAREAGLLVGVGSEAPSNGIPPSVRRWVKDCCWFRRIVRTHVRRVVESASFIVNYSGDDTNGLKQVGWPEEKIIPFGYYPRLMTGAVFRERDMKDWANFSLLVTGAMDWRRGQDIVIAALEILKKWGYSPKTIITQKGELFPLVEREIREGKLDNVRLCGFAPYDELLSYYETCSAFVASGRIEPWGMRINDALNMGAPLIVSRGMGGVKIVRDCGAGCEYDGTNPFDLAYKIKRLMDDQEYYLRLARETRSAAETCSPEARARWLAGEIRRRFPEWR